MFNSIWCEEVKVPAEFKEGTRLVYTYINGKNEKGYTFAEVSSFLATGSKEDVQRAVDSLLTQADDTHHVFIEGFDLTDNGSYEVVLGS